MKSTARIVSNRVDDVCPSLSAAKLTTRWDEPGDVGHCDRAAFGQTALLSKLLFPALNLTEIVETPRLRIRTGVNSSDEQQWSQPKKRKAKRKPALACGHSTKES